ncbi:hypothetical protein V8B97DRAFT_2025652 [Scleroderma yunnanense]
MTLAHLWKKLIGSKETTEILPTDIVVFIVGPSGSGKSSFLRELVRNENVQVNKGQKPCTKHVKAERCRFNEIANDIVVVDTPSFHTYVDPDGEDVMRSWMNSKYTKQCKAATVLYMHDIAAYEKDANLAVRKHLDTFRRTFPLGNVIPQTVHILPILDRGMRQPVPPEKIAQRMASLRKQAEEANASMFPTIFDGTPEMAWSAVQELLEREASRTGMSPIT